MQLVKYLKNDEDKTNSKYQEIKGKITNLYAEYSEKTSSVIPNILKMNREVVSQYINEQDDLKPASHAF